VTQQIVVRAFYAREDMWRPMALGTAIALAAAVLYYRLGLEYGAAGLAAAGAIAMSVNALATLALARVVHGGPQLGALAGSALRAVLVALPAAWAAAWVPSLEVAGAQGRALDLALAGCVFAVIALACVALVGDAPLRAALRRLLRLGP
jgi:peptidoglycan biosynthesis protein MviN/MurJ (putative lipid II flippase)